MAKSESVGSSNAEAICPSSRGNAIRRKRLRGNSLERMAITPEREPTTQEKMATSPPREPTVSSYSYAQDDTVDPPYNKIRGLNLDDQFTQAVLHMAEKFTKRHPRKYKVEGFSTLDCAVIHKMLDKDNAKGEHTKEEVEHILTVSYELFVNYCSMMRYRIPGISKNLKFNFTTGQVFPAKKKYGVISRSFYANNQSTIQSFELLRSIFHFTWDKLFGDEGVRPLVRDGGVPLAVANHPSGNTSIPLQNRVANHPSLSTSLQLSNWISSDNDDTDSE